MPSKLGEPRHKLVPGEDGQARRLLHDRDQDLLPVDPQYGDRTAAGITSEAARPSQDVSEFLRCQARLDRESLNEPLECMARQPHRAIVALSGRRARHHFTPVAADTRRPTIDLNELLPGAAPGTAACNRDVEGGSEQESHAA
jgi:hypothetical protein